MDKVNSEPDYNSGWYEKNQVGRQQYQSDLKKWKSENKSQDQPQHTPSEIITGQAHEIDSLRETSRKLGDMISDYKNLLSNFTTCPQVIIDNPSFVQGKKPTDKDLEWAEKARIEFESQQPEPIEMPDIEPLIEKFLPNQFDLSTFKRKEILFLQGAFQQGAAVMFHELKNTGKLQQKGNNDLPEQQGWINVEDKMPEENTWILVNNGYWTGVAKYDKPEDDEDMEKPEWQDETSEFFTPIPTHWQPLPAPPKK